MSKEWPLWEVFIRSQHGLAHKHVGSLHAPDAEMAINNARDVYTRRNEGVGIWVVRAVDIELPCNGADFLLGEVVRHLAQCLLLVSQREVDH